MSHITVDKLEQAWEELNEAQSLAENNNTHRAVMKCDESIKQAFKSAHGMDYGEWFIEREEPVRNDIVMLKKSQDPPQNAVFDLISESKELIQQTRDKIIPELHSRIEYSPTPTFE